MGVSEMSEGEKVYLEDLSVGQRSESAPVELTAEAIKAFAAQFDPQPFHLDEGAAEGSFFRGLAADDGSNVVATMLPAVAECSIARASRCPRPVATCPGATRRARTSCTSGESTSPGRLHE